MAGLFACTAPDAAAPATSAEAAEHRAGDPAGVAGRWSYRTRSNCGAVEGVGELIFAWDPGRGRYREQGCVHWSDNGSTIWWWGEPRFDAHTRELVGRNRNSLGDEVDGHWSVEGEGPDRLAVSWSQTNGCRGEGVAIRAAAPPGAVAGSVLSMAALWVANRSDGGPSPCDASRAGEHLWPLGR
jgi:hypothetical protein